MSRERAPSLDAIFDPRRNSLNAIRLGLALLVIVSHAWPLAGYHWEPNFGGMSLGTWSVVGFFAVSGFLITASRTHGRTAVDYWIARILRIMPGLIVALIVVAFGFAPLSALVQHGSSWSPTSSVTYVLRNLLLYPFRLYQSRVTNTLVGFPYRDWDGPLWTLFWEGACYLAIGIAVSLFGRGRGLRWFVTAVFALGTIVAVADLLGGSGLPMIAVRVTPMLLAFSAGAVLSLLRARVPVSWPWSALAAVVVVVVVASGTGTAFAALPAAYLLLLLGAVLPLQKVGAVNDLSYGVYIYAWPVQQLAIVLLGSAIAVPWMILLVIAATLPLAVLSSRFVEKPALRLKHGRAGSAGRLRSGAAPSR